MKNIDKNKQLTINNIKEMSREELEFFCLSLSANNESITNELIRAREIIEAYKKKTFGKSSEKINPDQLSLQLFDEAEVESDTSTVEPNIEQVIDVSYKRKKNNKRSKKLDMSHLDASEIEYIIPQEDRYCYICNGPLHHIRFQSRKELKYIPAKIEVVEHKRELCGCRNCQSTDEPVMVLADAPNPLIKGGVASASLVANIVNDKYDKALPLYRQETSFMRLGIFINRQNMSNWLINVTENYLFRMYEYMYDQLLKCEHIGADETSVQVLHEDGKVGTSKSYMWLYMTGRSEKTQMVLFDYQPNRNHEHAPNFLKDYSGLLTSDGYKAYLDVAEATNVGCWAHARRYFIKAKDIIPEAKVKDSQTMVMLNLIGKLYTIERKIKNWDYDKVLEYRQDKAKPIVDEIFEKAHILNMAPSASNKFKEAITYLVNQEKTLREYLKYGCLEIDNNYVERAIRPFTIGRKNWVFMNTSRGAHSSAIIYSLVESAKLNNLKPYDYFNHIFEILPNIDIYNDRKLEELMPWSELPVHLYNKN